MDMELALGNMRNVIVLEVKNPLRMLNDDTGITRDEAEEGHARR